MATPPITRDLPAPLRGKRYIYPTEFMALGESFFIPLARRRPENVVACIYNSIKRFRARFHKVDRDFITRRVRENGVEGVRCWRIR